MKVKILTSHNARVLAEKYDEFQESVPYIDPYSLKIESHMVTEINTGYCLILTVLYSDDPNEIQNIQNPSIWDAQYETFGNNCNCNCYQLGEDITDLASPKE